MGPVLWNPEGGLVSADDLTDDQLAAVAERYGVPKRYAAMNRAGWRDDWTKLPAAVDSWLGAPWALTLFGRPGTGKTHAMAIVFRRLLARNLPSGRVPGWWFYLPEVVEAVKAGFDRDVDDPQRHRAERLKERATTVQVGFFDDLGAELGEWGSQLVQSWLELRHARMLSTVVTCNAPNLKALAQRMPRLASRLGEGADYGCVITFEGKDRRSEQGAVTAPAETW